MTDSGKLRGLLSLQKKADGDDGFGTVIPGAGAWEEQAKASAQMSPLTRGAGEAVTNARLTGVQPYVARIRSTSVTRLMDNTWRAVDRNGKIYDVTAVADPFGDNHWLDVMMTQGAVA